MSFLSYGVVCQPPHGLFSGVLTFRPVVFLAEYEEMRRKVKNQRFSDFAHNRVLKFVFLTTNTQIYPILWLH